MEKRDKTYESKDLPKDIDNRADSSGLFLVAINCKGSQDGCETLSPKACNSCSTHGVTFHVWPAFCNWKPHVSRPAMMVP